MGSRIFRHGLAGLGLVGGLLLVASEGRAAAVDPSGDLDHVRPLLEQTLETEKSGIEIRWSNPGTGHSGKIRIERTFFRNDQPCRDYLRTVDRPDRSGFVIRGTACRTGRAVWTIGDESMVETDPPKKAAARPEPPAPREAKREAPERPAGTADASRPHEGERPGAGTTAEAAAEEPDPAEEPFVTFTLPSRSPI